MKLPDWLNRLGEKKKKPAPQSVMDNPYRPIYRKPRRVEDVRPHPKEK